jgi:predicted HTH transcriptional regulator
MTPPELLQILQMGETSQAQFKQDWTSNDQVAAELIAFANSKGGLLLFGVRDDGSAAGLNFEQIQKIGSGLATVANESVKPIVPLTTEVVWLGDAKILVASGAEGVSKPYKDRNGTIWIKQGPDKRKVTENAEIMRLFQEGGQLHVDETPIPGSSPDDILQDEVAKYLRNLFQEETVPPPNQYLYENLGILR